jgi:hypothetical protein
MKFCKKRVYEYKGFKGCETSTNYVTLNDIKEFHGKEFVDQFLKFVSFSGLNESIFGSDSGYYFIDYQFYAQRTKTYLESN